MPTLIERWFPANLSCAAVRQVAGASDELFAQALWVHSALTYPVALPK